MPPNRDMADFETRLARVEKLLGPVPETSSQVTIFGRLREIEAMVEGVRKSVEDIPPFIESKITSCEEEVSTLTDAVDIRLEGILDDLRVVKHAIRSVDEGHSHGSKLRVPEPKAFEGERSSKELENFVWDVEEYLKAARIPEAEKVSIVSMYLTGDAKLWWRTRQSDEISASRGKVGSWAEMKKELRDQFLPCNAGWIARDALRKLKHGTSVRDYVNEFTSLMLQIKEMAEEDKLFNFLSGLQPWAQTELRRQRVKDLPSALAAAEELVDFKAHSEPDRGDAGRAKDKGKAGKKKVPSDPPTDQAGTSRFGGGERKRGCFICEGDHRMRECPKRNVNSGEKVNAIVTESDEEEVRMSTLQLVTAMQVLNENQNVTEVGRGVPTDADLGKKISSVGRGVPAVGRGVPTYAEVLARAAPSIGRGVPIKAAACGKQVMTGSKGVLKRDSHHTTRASSGFGGGGLLRP